MTIEDFEFVLEKARKIMYYEKHRLTDEEFEKRKKGLLIQYNVAKKKFKLTGDNKFLIKMRRMQAMLKNTVSPTEYKLCTEVIDNCKKNYGNIISEERWTYDELFYLHLYILSRHTDTVEQAFLTE